MQPESIQKTDAGVVGIGASTAIGRTAPASAAAVRAGIAGFHEHPFMVDTAGEKMIVARAPYLDEESGVERLLALAVPAAREALAPLDAVRERLSPIPVTLGLPPARPGLPSAGTAQTMADHLVSALRDTGRVGRVETIPIGHSAGLVALEQAWRAIQNGQDEFHLIGGVDSYLEPETLEWLERCEQLHGAGPSNNAWGFIPGEAAGFCLLASPAAQERYKVSSRCRVLAVATAMEENRIKTDTVCVGAGLSAAIKPALAALPITARVDQTICDLNGEPYRADEFGFALARTSERFVDANEFLAPADCWGDVGAASAPTFISLAVAAAGRGYARGAYYLIWTSSESGERGSALLRLDLTLREAHV